MSRRWERVLSELEEAAAAAERAGTVPAIALPADLGPLPQHLMTRATAVLARMHRAERALEAASVRAQRAMAIDDAATPASSPRFIDARS